MNQRVRAFAQCVKASTRHGVTGCDDTGDSCFRTEIETEANARLNRLVIGLPARNPNVAGKVNDTLGHFNHSHRRPVIEIWVVGEAVLDVGVK